MPVAHANSSSHKRECCQRNDNVNKGRRSAQLQGRLREGKSTVTASSYHRHESHRCDCSWQKHKKGEKDSSSSSSSRNNSVTAATAAAITAATATATAITKAKPRTKNNTKQEQQQEEHNNRNQNNAQNSGFSAQTSIAATTRASQKSAFRPGETLGEILMLRTKMSRATRPRQKNTVAAPVGRRRFRWCCKGPKVQVEMWKNRVLFTFCVAVWPVEVFEDLQNPGRRAPE